MDKRPKKHLEKPCQIQNVTTVLQTQRRWQQAEGQRPVSPSPSTKAGIDPIPQKGGGAHGKKPPFILCTNLPKFCKTLLLTGRMSYYTSRVRKIRYCPIWKNTVFYGYPTLIMHEWKWKIWILSTTLNEVKAKDVPNSEWNQHSHIPLNSVLNWHSNWSLNVQHCECQFIELNGDS